MSDYKDIWNSGDDSQRSLTEEQLLAYSEGRLSPEERRVVEELMSHEGAESDALEGLQQLTAEETKSLKTSLHISLQKNLGKKHKTRRGLAEQRWTWTAIVVILLLAILCYAVMYLAKASGK